MAYVYRFKDANGKVIYVGRALELDARIRTHFSASGHLPKECYEITEEVEFLKFDTPNEMKIKELYYIGLHKPDFNSLDVSDVGFGVDTSGDDWQKYTLLEKNLSSGKRRLDRKKVTISMNTHVLEKLDELKSVFKENQSKWIIEQAISEMYARYMGDTA